MNSYFTYYNVHYKPYINYLDITLKSATLPTLEDVAQIMDITTKDLSQLLVQLNLPTITKNNLLQIVFLGHSDFCQLIKRQMHIGIKSYYTFQEISYIYQLPQKVIKKAMFNGNIETITPENITEILKHIYINVDN